MNNLNVKIMSIYDIEGRGSIYCKRCNGFYIRLAHVDLYQEQICNSCCRTSRYFPEDGPPDFSEFLGCDCEENMKTEWSINKKEVIS